jgi:hypothetical protein
VVVIRQELIDRYTAAPANDKPSHLFILGHVPLPRAGRDGTPPDEHMENIGARGADTYYADLDGIYTDTGTFDPGFLATPLAINLPGDHKWDQDALTSDLELAFGRADFADLASPWGDEMALMEGYLAKLHAYKNVAAGWYMGNRAAFRLGYDNSNDGSYRSLVPVASADSVVQEYTGDPHPQWVQANGPFMCYMQNSGVPNPDEWTTYGMDATIFSSDQSYYGFGDVPREGSYSLIRELLGADTKCVGLLWTTMAINVFHQIGAGVTVGQAFQQIMEHDTLDEKLEKPTQLYDTPDFWSRTQFAYFGDPTVRLHQVMPPSAMVVSGTSGNISLSWAASPDPRSPRYHVYRSAAELGPYERITTTPLMVTSFVDVDGDPWNWYMVRAVIEQRTGAGVFIDPSIGVFAEPSTLVAGTEASERITLFPVPCADVLHVSLPVPATRVGFSIRNVLGEEVTQGSINGPLASIRVDGLAPGPYLLVLAEGSIRSARFIKR